MKKLNVKPITYFDNIDSEYKAYILGFIYADGNINDKVKGKREWGLCVSIQEEDGYILQKLLDDTNKKKINISNPPAVIKNNWKKRAVAHIGNTYLCNTLINLGCYPRKSQLGMKFPIIPKHLIHHFIRGFFDGDGCVTIKKRTYKGKKVTSEYFHKIIAFTSTDSIFLDEVMKNLPITKIYKRQKLRSLLVHTYWIERKEDVQNVYNYLYKDATYFLKRKYDKFNKSIKSQAIDTFIEGLETT